ncbi:MAG: hypothetical protein KKH97_08295 [Proteobacteria bacterium]|nr:hypothetical protein [Pseudomonadota bacterium]MBU1712549.1 hypothetical protein [Pseudomonadota bacterium]
MKRIGIIGGIGPESTVDYYKLIIGAHVLLKLPAASYGDCARCFGSNMREVIGSCRWI